MCIRDRAAGIELAPGKDKPIASVIAVIVLAVPIVIQCPYDLAIPASTSCQSLLLILPALN